MTDNFPGIVLISSNDPICFMVDSSGRKIDLSSICGKGLIPQNIQNSSVLRPSSSYVQLPRLVQGSISGSPMLTGDPKISLVFRNNLIEVTGVIKNSNTETSPISKAFFQILNSSSSNPLINLTTDIEAMDGLGSNEDITFSKLIPRSLIISDRIEDLALRAVGYQ